MGHSLRNSRQSILRGGPGPICSQHMHANEGLRSPGFKRLDDHLPMGQSVTLLQTPNALGICSISLGGQLTFSSSASGNMSVRLTQGSRVLLSRKRDY
ncbi:uncharacterized [Tachysurus ichikawai]